MVRWQFEWAPQAAKLLNGVFCVYKPEGLSTARVIHVIKQNLAKDLNKLPCYKYESLKKKSPENGDLVGITDNHETSKDQLPHYMPALTTVPTVTEDLSEHRLVLGDRYLPEDFRINYVTGLHKSSSGLIICGLGSANRHKIRLISQARFLNVYHVKGRFGYCTQDFSPTGPLIERTTFHHINKVLVDKICATIQGNHQKHIFEYAGVHPESEEAYKMACRGLVRPDTSETPPMIYSVKCIDFKLPDMTLEMHTINEECMYLKQIVSDLGYRLKSSAVCPQIRRIRQGQFTLDYALLRKDWHLEAILENMRLCRKFTKPDQLVSDFNIEQSQEDIKHLPVSDQKVLPGSGNTSTDEPNNTVHQFLKKIEHV